MTSRHVARLLPGNQEIRQLKVSRYKFSSSLLPPSWSVAWITLRALTLFAVFIRDVLSWVTTFGYYAPPVLLCTGHRAASLLKGFGGGGERNNWAMHPHLAWTFSTLVPTASEASSQQGAPPTHADTLANDLQPVDNQGSFLLQLPVTLSGIEVIRRDEFRWRNFNVRS